MRAGAWRSVGDRTELTHHSEVVKQGPVLDQHPIADLKKIEDVNIDATSSCRHFAKGPGVRALNFETDEYFLALGDKVEQRQLHVGEGRQ